MNVGEAKTVQRASNLLLQWAKQIIEEAKENERYHAGYG